MPACHYCGCPIDPLSRVGIRDECPKCHRDLHICKNCRFWDPSAHNQCRETQSEPVHDRERANYCTYFSPGAVAPTKSREATAARKKLDELFKKR